MAGNSFGQVFRLTTFGESHGPALGGVIDGCPAGLALDMLFIQAEMARRRPGQSSLTTQRDEPDEVVFLSGTFEGKTTGTPLAFLVWNKDHRSSDYEKLRNVYRPSHADFTYEAKYKVRDYRGGGRASARETVARVIGGAVAKLLLRESGIGITGYVSQIGTVTLDKDYTALDPDLSASSPVRCPDPEKSAEMARVIENLIATKDTTGGRVTCIITGVPAGIGEPVFDKLQADLAKAMLSINAAKGFEYGSGFRSASMTGSCHNDRFISVGDRIVTLTNNSGGIQGGISNGQDIYFNVAFKPVATVMREQETVDRDGHTVTLEPGGRHDVCVVPRAVPIVEAMAALVVADHILRNRSSI